MIDKEILSKHIPNIQRLEKMEESTDGNVYMLYTNNNKYIVKIYDSLNHTKSMISLHNDLNKNNFYVPKIIKINNQEYLKINNKYIVVYSFLEGKQLNTYETIPKEIVIKLALELRRLHDLTTNRYNLDKVPFNIAIKTNRYSALHFDLTRMNIFLNNDKIGFIDFDDAKYGASICDVVITSALLFFSKRRGSDLNNFNLFIDTYYGEDTVLKNKEIPYIKEIAFAYVDGILDDNKLDASTLDSFRIKKNLIANLTIDK